ncbi:MAG: ROK family transcriptional regulator [Proteobacteria bacterium]|nr:ROK family transcriptional regulator [Pseudomonadota bacterium]
MQIKVDTGDTELIRAINRYRIVDTVRRLEPVSRQVICEKTGLSRSTVSIAVNALMAEGVLRDDDIAESVVSARGRPTSLLRINPNAAYVVGMKLSAQDVTVVATNLRADTLATLTLPIRPWRLGTESLCHMLEDGLGAVVAQAGIQREEIAGVGIGLPVIEDLTQGGTTRSPLLSGETTQSFAAMLQARLDLPVTVDSDANLLALAERWFGQGRDVDNFAVVLVGYGIGMGIFVNGVLHRGAHRLGAEFGHMKIDWHGPQCHCGQHGCVEAYAAESAIVAKAREHMTLPPDDEIHGTGKALQAAAAEARAGHAGLRTVFAQAGEALGVGIANVINLMDPSRIIVAGPGVRAYDLFGEAMIEAVRHHSIKRGDEACEIVVHDWPVEAWVRGAVSLILEKLYARPILKLKS